MSETLGAISDLETRLQSERAATLRRLRDIDRALAAVRLANSALSGESTEPRRGQSRENVGTGSSPEEIVSAASEIMREAAKPIRSSSLREQIEARGLVIPARRPNSYLTTILWRNKDRFERIPGHGYQLRSTASHPALTPEPSP